MSDCAITILHAHPHPRGDQRRLTKLVCGNGRILGYDDALLFNAVELPVPDLRHLGEILLELLSYRDRCVVRGSLIHGSPASGIRRLYHPCKKTGDPPTLYEIPRRWIAIDVDGDVFERPASLAAADVAGCARIAMVGPFRQFRRVTADLCCLPRLSHGRHN
jgi:hypothetical protein